MHTQDLTTLENLVDRWTMTEVLQGLGAIAEAKADHLRSNWQDAASAREWLALLPSIDSATRKAVAIGL